MKNLLLIILCIFSIQLFAQENQVEIAPMTNASNTNSSIRDTFNLSFSFPTIAFIGEYGVETDGEDIYVTQWLDDSIATYDQAGNVLDEFVIPGVGRTRDLAYDGQYYYGSPNEFFFYVLDLDNKTLINTIQTTFQIRGMAYDPIEDVLWASEHWSPMFYKLDKQGNILDSWLPSGITMDAISGLAFDNFSPGGPFLWGFSQDSTGAVIIKYDIPNQTQTGNMIDVSVLVTDLAYAGGLFIHQMDEKIVPVIGGMVQNQLVFALELSYANMLVGIESQEHVSLLNVYPNPVQDVLRFQYRIPYAGHQVIEIYSVGGKRMKKMIIEEIVPGTYEVEIDVSELTEGMYFLQLTVESGMKITKKFLKTQ